jgi:glycosyltransferase involved in cell wall biosynthesis
VSAGALRIAVLTRYVHDAGGVEAYLRGVLPALRRGGHDLAVWHEFAVPAGRSSGLGADVPCHALDDVDRSAGEIRDWRPDVLFLNGLSQPSTEMRLMAHTPTVTFLHGYHGTCVSGGKTWMFPSPTPCSRPLGPACLLHYYPRRCGGLDPAVMLDAYKQQRLRQQLLHRSAFVATFSEHMRREAIANGVEPGRAVHLPAFDPGGFRHGESSAAGATASSHQWHLGFIGRMETPKGALVLLDAVAHLDASLRARLRVTFAGDGREKAALQRAAARIPDVEFAFPGWIDACGRARLLSTLDLLVVPSIWPEPLGLIGIEAAAAGVPAVAFDVGGIGDWLEDDLTGRLVRGTAPSSAGLGRAIADALGCPERLRAWGTQARERSRRLTIDAHMSALEDVLRRAAEAAR